MNKKLKLKKSEIKTCRVAYLYHDGHMVLMHEKQDKDAGTVSWVTIYENVGIVTHFKEKGRLIIDKSVLPFLAPCSRVDVRPATFEGGSERTKEKGIAVESVSLYNGSDYHGWHISNFPGIISSDIYFNNNDTGTFKDVKDKFHWCDSKIKHIYTVD